MARLVELKSFYDISEAHIVSGLLESHGIKTFLFDDGLANMCWMYMTAISGIRLMVVEDDAEEAAAILAETDEVILEEGVDNCPNCQSGDVFRQPSWIAGALALLTFGQILLAQTHSRSCRQCGHKWEEA